MSPTSRPSASFDMRLPSLDPLLHQPIRTQITAYLSGRGEASFAELKRTLGITDGNLDAHMSKLLEAGYVLARKESAVSGRGRAQTTYVLSEEGRVALRRYVEALSALLAPGQQSEGQAKSVAADTSLNSLLRPFGVAGPEPVP